jgi:hypothetical protein
MKLGKVNKFQVGGQIPTQGTEDPMAVLMQGAAQAVQAQDCQVAMQVCQMLVEMAGAAAAPAEAAPAPAETEPVYRMGGKLARRINK